MCGIAGFIDKNIAYDSLQISNKMGEAIYTRGPDSSGIWQDVNLGVNLVHRRLAILDMSPAGHQPMISRSGRYIIIFNGEIYNFKKILSSLEAKLGSIAWHGHSDTEVILLAIETYGFENALKMFEGMFAIALWDREKERLYLARDRIGEKPLYYGYFNRIFGFTSELKAFKKHPKFNSQINRDAIGQLMLHNCIPAPLSIFEKIYKLLPGHYLELGYRDYLNQIEPTSKPYWQLSDCNFESYTGTLSEALNDLEHLLQDVIKEQMVADVPVGCFLSGGVDSSVIAALMQSLSSKKIQTFSIGFDKPEYNEAEFAKAVAKHIGSDHNELYITDKDALNVIPFLPIIYDEPFSDSSQIPTYLVCKLARQKVTVSLSGDAGDELFAGYSRYLLAENLYNKVGSYPDWLKRTIKRVLPLISPDVLNAINKIIKLPVTNFSDKIYKIESILDSKDFKQFYLSLASHWLNYSSLVLGEDIKSSLWNREISKFSFDDNKVLGMQYLDSLGYLPDDILVKVDRAAMANSLETRVPFLNHKVVEFAFSLPQSYKIKDGLSKYVLRQVLYNYVPKELIERPKRGFAVPIQDWLRGELKDWAVALLDSHKLDSEGYLNSSLVQDKLQQHLSGRANNGYYLWDVLMFEQWLDNWNKL
jgi:asparagine synthase (glutamine-hydrolysing)